MKRQKLRTFLSPLTSRQTYWVKEVRSASRPSHAPQCALRPKRRQLAANAARRAMRRRRRRRRQRHAGAARAALRARPVCTRVRPPRPEFVAERPAEARPGRRRRRRAQRWPEGWAPARRPAGRLAARGHLGALDAAGAQHEEAGGLGLGAHAAGQQAVHVRQGHVGRHVHNLRNAERLVLDRQRERAF